MPKRSADETTAEGVLLQLSAAKAPENKKDPVIPVLLLPNSERFDTTRQLADFLIKNQRFLHNTFLNTSLDMEKTLAARGLTKQTLAQARDEIETAFTTAMSNPKTCVSITPDEEIDPLITQTVQLNQTKHLNKRKAIIFLHRHDFLKALAHGQVTLTEYFSDNFHVAESLAKALDPIASLIEIWQEANPELSQSRHALFSKPNSLENLRKQYSLKNYVAQLTEIEATAPAPTPAVSIQQNA